MVIVDHRSVVKKVQYLHERGVAIGGCSRPSCLVGPPKPRSEAYRIAAYSVGVPGSCRRVTSPDCSNILTVASTSAVTCPRGRDDISQIAATISSTAVLPSQRSQIAAAESLTATTGVLSAPITKLRPRRNSTRLPGSCSGHSLGLRPGLESTSHLPCLSFLPCLCLRQTDFESGEEVVFDYHSGCLDTRMHPELD